MNGIHILLVCVTGVFWGGLVGLVLLGVGFGINILVRKSQARRAAQQAEIARAHDAEREAVASAKHAEREFASLREEHDKLCEEHTRLVKKLDAEQADGRECRASNRRLFCQVLALQERHQILLKVLNGAQVQIIEEASVDGAEKPNTKGDQYDQSVQDH